MFRKCLLHMWTWCWVNFRSFNVFTLSALSKKRTAEYLLMWYQIGLYPSDICMWRGSWKDGLFTLSFSVYTSAIRGRIEDLVLFILLSRVKPFHVNQRFHCSALKRLRCYFHKRGTQWSSPVFLSNHNQAGLHTNMLHACAAQQMLLFFQRQT